MSDKKSLTTEERLARIEAALEQIQNSLNITVGTLRELALDFYTRDAADHQRILDDEEIDENIKGLAKSGKGFIQRIAKDVR